MKIAASSVLRAKGRTMSSTCPESTYFSRSGPSTLFESAAQCGQVGEAYSISVTLASGLPATLSGTPAGAISRTWSITSPSRAAAGRANPMTPTADAAAARVKVSRRFSFTTGTPWFGGKLHAGGGGASDQSVRIGHVRARRDRPSAAAFSCHHLRTQRPERLPQTRVGDVGHRRAGPPRDFGRRRRIVGHGR